MGSKPLWLNGLGSTAKVDKSSKPCYNTYIDSKEHIMDINTFFVFMALIGGPALCIVTILICGKEDK
jgi:hypothetical protein